MNRTSTLLLLAALLFFAVFCPAAPADSGRWQQKDFIITFWCPPPATDEVLSQVAREGYTMTWTPPEGLDVAARHHLRAMLTSDLLQPQALDDPAKCAELERLIERVKRHPALEAYYITDEPGAGAFPALGRLVAWLRERDPAHLAYINLFPTYANEDQLGVSADASERARVGYPQNFAGVGTDDKTVMRYQEHLKRFIETVQTDLISYDHYHFLKTGDGSQYFLNLALIRMAAIENHKPFLNIIQANTIEKVWRLPNAEELRFLVFTTLAYGGRGISYFTYWGPAEYNGIYQDGKPSPLAPIVSGLNSEMRKFGPELMRLKSTAVYHSAPLPYGTQLSPSNAPVRLTGSGEFVLGLFEQPNKLPAFMVVNRDYKSSSVVNLSLIRRNCLVQELDRTTGHWTLAKPLPNTGAMKVELRPGDGRLFRLKQSPLHSPRGQ